MQDSFKRATIHETTACFVQVDALPFKAISLRISYDERTIISTVACVRKASATSGKSHRTKISRTNEATPFASRMVLFFFICMRTRSVHLCDSCLSKSSEGMCGNNVSKFRFSRSQINPFELSSDRMGYHAGCASNSSIKFPLSEVCFNTRRARSGSSTHIVLMPCILPHTFNILACNDGTRSELMSCNTVGQFSK